MRVEAGKGKEGEEDVDGILVMFDVAKLLNVRSLWRSRNIDRKRSRQRSWDVAFLLRAARVSITRMGRNR